MAASSSEMKEEIAELRGEVEEYKPGKAAANPDRIPFPDNLYIGLFGRTGCGKTSLINSLKFAASGRLRRSKWLQVASQEKAGGHTMFRKIANLTESIYVIDNRGLDDPNTEQAVIELAAQLDGERGYSDKIEWQEANEADERVDDIDKLEVDVEAGHKIGCAVFVFSARHDLDTNTTGLSDVVDFLHGHQGRYPVAVITHVDVAEKTHVENLKMVLRVSGVSDIFEVANLTSEKMKLEEAYQHSLLSLLERCINDGDETLIFKHYQRKEQERKAAIERKKREKQERDAQERSAREEAQRARDEERQLQEERRRADREHTESEFTFKLEQERFRHEMEMERQKMAADDRERQDREREREQRFQEALRKAESDKQLELIRVMQANQRPQEKSGCSIM